MNKPVTLTSLLLFALLAALAGCETYPRQGAVQVHERHYDARIAFSSHDVELIRGYYAPRHPHGYPPGLAKKGKVPPGHAKKLQRGEALPRDYQWQAIPRDLDARLSPLPSGYVRVLVGSDICIMNVHTRVLVDLMENIAD